MAESLEEQVASLFRLDGRVVLVTGGAGHLGHAMSSALAAAGAHVYVSSRTPARLEVLADSLVSDGFRATALPMDVTNTRSVADGIGVIGAESGRLDIIVNNAYAGGTGSLATIGPEDMAATYDVTTVAAHRLVTAALDLLKVAGTHGQTASIVNIASMYGVVSPDPGLYDDDLHRQPPDYGAAKASLIQYTRYLATHLAEHSIRANAVSPGPFPKSADEAFLRRLEARVPLKRTGRPEELASAVLFLASEASSYITGANLAVDGGWTAW